MGLSRQQKRVRTIRQKYGVEQFRKWGVQGGSPILRLYKQGKLRRVA